MSLFHAQCKSLEEIEEMTVTAVKLKSEEKKMGFTNSACRLNRKTPEKKQLTIVELLPQVFQAEIRRFIA